MGKGFKGKTCVYCATAPAATMDHVFAREFFRVDRRGNLPKVPACAARNGAKSSLEHYLTAVLPFGGRHADGMAHLTEMVPGRLAHNQKLARQLSKGLSTNVVLGGATPTMTIPSIQTRSASYSPSSRKAWCGITGRFCCHQPLLVSGPKCSAQLARNSITGR
jgi:hypothetical protein